MSIYPIGMGVILVGTPPPFPPCPFVSLLGFSLCIFFVSRRNTIGCRYITRVHACSLYRVMCLGGVLLEKGKTAL